jgi:hypothetical protein
MGDTGSMGRLEHGFNIDIETSQSCGGAVKVTSRGMAFAASRV